MTKDEYERYLKSDEWKMKRKIFLDFWEGKCGLCPKQAIDVHHRDYECAGNERFWDCIPLCRECHQRHHGIIEKGRETQALFANLGNLPEHIFEGVP